MALEKHPVGPEGATVQVWREGTGSPLLYLHGMEHHPGPAGFLRRLAASHDVLAPELPGYGSSTGGDGVNDVWDLLLFERELIESWSLGPLDVVGHSLGGMLAAELAVWCPHLVRRLVLVDAYGLWLDDVPAPDPYTMAPAELAQAKWHDPAAAPDPEPSLAGPSADDPHAAMLVRARNLATSTKFLWPIPDRGLRKRLRLITAPTLVVHGASDGLLPLAYGEELARLIPGSTLAVIPDAGHLPMIEQEDAFLDVVERFLSTDGDH